MLKKLHLTDVHVAGEIGRLELFHILHTSRKALAGPIGESIQAMAKSGEIKWLVQKYEADFTRGDIPP
jgi:hypothetical protein